MYNNMITEIKNTIEGSQDDLTKSEILSKLEVIDESFQVLQSYYIVLANYALEEKASESTWSIIKAFNDLKRKYLKSKHRLSYEEFTDAVENHPSLICPFAMEINRTNINDEVIYTVKKCILGASVDIACSYSINTLKQFMNNEYPTSKIDIVHDIKLPTCTVTINREIYDNITII